MTFFDETYEYDILGGDEVVFRYRFQSKGDYLITKLVSIHAISRIQNGYNLGFGNYEIAKDGIAFSNDMATKNNNDFDKVLKTVFKCVVHYLVEVNPTARILFFGNTEHKQQIYLRKIGKYAKELSNYLIIEGGSLEGEVNLVEQEHEVERRGKKVKRKIKVKDEESIQSLIKTAKIQFIEPFDSKRTKDYQFVSIQLK